MHEQFLVGFHPTYNGGLWSAVSWVHFIDGKRRRRYLHNQRMKASSSASKINNRKDHYAVLELKRSATTADIKKSYRLLARKYHPDVSKHSQAAEDFKSIHSAYQVLSNAATRARYDRELEFRVFTNHPFCQKHSTCYNSNSKPKESGLLQQIVGVLILTSLLCPKIIMLGNNICRSPADNVRSSCEQSSQVQE